MSESDLLEAEFPHNDNHRNDNRKNDNHRNDANNNDNNGITCLFETNNNLNQSEHFNNEKDHVKQVEHKDENKNEHKTMNSQNGENKKESFVNRCYNVANNVVNTVNKKWCIASLTALATITSFASIYYFKMRKPSSRR
jgi:hypothetical protein